MLENMTPSQPFTDERHLCLTDTVSLGDGQQCLPLLAPRSYIPHGSGGQARIVVFLSHAQEFRMRVRPVLCTTTQIAAVDTCWVLLPVAVSPLLYHVRGVCVSITQEKMVGAHARRCITAVQNPLVTRYGTVAERPGHTMSTQRMALIVNHSVSVREEPSRPHPARPRYVNLRPETGSEVSVIVRVVPQKAQLPHARCLLNVMIAHRSLHKGRCVLSSQQYA
jgi:hypothetical protein